MGTGEFVGLGERARVWRDAHQMERGGGFEREDGTDRPGLPAPRRGRGAHDDSVATSVYSGAPGLRHHGPMPGPPPKVASVQLSIPTVATTQPGTGVFRPMAHLIKH